MVAIRISEFHGAVPRTTPENLGAFQAQVATNCRLWNKKLKAWNGRENISAIAAGVKSILNLQGNWLTFQEDVDVCMSQLAGDQTGRIFFTGNGAPQMSDLSMALIGKTSVISTTVTDKSLPHSFVNAATIASLGITVGSYVNASVQIADPSADVVNGRVQITFFNSTPAVISTTDGSMVQGCGEYDVSILKHLQVPAGTVTITVKALVDSASAGATARFCYLTLGDFSASALPVASVPLGLAQPGAPTAAKVAPTFSITAATSYAAAIANNGSATIACDGTAIEVIGTMSFFQLVKAATHGNVTVSLLRGGSVVDSKDFAFSCVGSATEPNDRQINGSFTFNDQPPAGSRTYSFSISPDFSGGTGAGTPITSVKGKVSYAKAVDITVTGHQTSNVQTVGNTILDPNGTMQKCIIAGATAGSAPTFKTSLGGLTVDGTCTWCVVSTMDFGTKIHIGQTQGMTAINGNTTVVSASANVIRVNIDTQQTYTSGGVIVVSFDATNEVDRVYAYTYVANLDGESLESEPSAATDLITVEPDRIIAVTLPATPSGFDITNANLYRTVSDGQGGAVLVFVASIPTTDGAAPTPYYDAQSDTQLSGTLLTATWSPPPADMIGLVALPNGVYVGFNSNQIIPSVPYQPQAYPVEYQLGTEFEIVSVKPFGQSLAVLTKGKPYVINGPDPSTWIMQNTDMNQPCLSKRGVVDMGFGVVYPCPDGLAMISNSGVEVITGAVFTKDVWAALDPTSITAANYAGLYVGFYTGGSGGGFIFDPLSPTDITFLDFQGTAAWTDPATNSLYMNVGNEIVQWDADAGNPLTYTWQSRDFVLPHPLNLSRAKVRAKTYPVTLKLYGDGVLQATKTVADSNVFTLPGGYRAQIYSVSVTGTAEILEVVVAESVSEIGAGTSQMTSMQAPVG